MKQVVFGVVAGFIVILCAVAVLTVEGRSNREHELKQALSAAVDETMQNVCVTHKYDVKDSDEFAADFCQALLERISTGTGEHQDGNLSIQVNVLEADPDRGLLSVAVTETFTHPNGKVGKVKCNSTAVLEREKEKQEVILTYCLGERIYRQFGLLQGQDFKIPEDPADPGRTFVCWIDQDTGQRAVFPERAVESKCFIAYFE